MTLLAFFSPITDALPPIVEKFWRIAVILIIAIILYKVLIKNIEKAFLKRVSQRNMRNVRVFINLINYLFFTILIIFLIFAYTGSITGFGISAGLLTAALGWALQKPITGIAAWIMIVTKRPFVIGDRVIIGEIKGDVDDITITHIYLSECGGTVDGEEQSGRVIMVPNSLLFEQNIINYTLKDPYILDEVVTMITYESSVDEAEKIAIGVAKKYTKDVMSALGTTPHTRLHFKESGIDVKLRYRVETLQRNKTATDITRELFKKFGKNKKVTIAYPHLTLVQK